MNNNTNITQFKETCAALRDAIPSAYTASWDDDFQVVRIVFDKLEQKPLLQTLRRIFNHQYDFTSIDGAGVFIENFISSIFGIIPGQLLFTSNDSDDPILFAVWWPWGNEAYISLRIGVYREDSSSADFKAAIKKQFTEWFDLDE